MIRPVPPTPEQVELALTAQVQEMRVQRQMFFGVKAPFPFLSPETREERLLADLHAGGSRRERALRELGA